MGWCSGTEVFDKVVAYILKSTLTTADKAGLIRILTEALENHDWDCQDDSIYANNPLVSKVMAELHPDWDE